MLQLGRSVVEELQYVILPARNCPESMQSYYEPLYELWKKGWTATFKELQSDAIPDAHEFLKQSLITGIFHKQKPIAFHSYGFYDLLLLPHREVSYLRSFGDEVIQDLMNRGVKDLMTMEHLFVNPQWRRETVGLFFASIVGSLAGRVLQCAPVDVAIAIARNDRGVNKISYDKGGECLAANRVHHHVNVDLVAFWKDTAREDLAGEDQDCLEALWDNRIDVSGVTLQSKQSARTNFLRPGGER